MSINKKTISLCVVMIIAILFFLCKDLFFDSKKDYSEYEIVEINNNNDIDFFGATISSGDYYIDYEKSICEIHLVESVMNMSEDELPDLLIKNQDKDSISYQMIKGNKYMTDKDMNYYYQNIILQIKIPHDFYYLDLELTQPKGDEYDQKIEHIKIDYRSFEDAKLVKKSKDWLKKQETMENDYYKECSEEDKNIDKKKDPSNKRDVDFTVRTVLDIQEIDD